MPGWLPWTRGGNRLNAREIQGIAILGDNSGLIIQHIGAAPPPDPPSLPWRDLPWQDLPAAIGTPGEIDIFNLLTWRTRLCQPLIGRDADSDNLLAWARSDRPFAIRVLSGIGGAGKTRLAAEVAEQLRQENRTAGFAHLDRREELPISRKGLFLAIDYPESHRRAVQAIFRSVATREHMSGAVTAPIRLLL